MLELETLILYVSEFYVISLCKYVPKFLTTKNDKAPNFLRKSAKSFETKTANF